MATRIFNMYAAQEGRPPMTDQTKPNAEAPERLCRTCKQPESYHGVGGKLLHDFFPEWARVRTLLAETPKPETQQVPLIAVRILLEGKPGAALNAVVEDYPELAKMILSRKPEMQAGAMSAKGFACLILLQEELSLEWLEAQVAARDAKRDAEVAKSARKAITDYIKSGKTISGEPTDLDLALDKFAAKIRAEASELAFLRGKLAAVKQYAPTRWTLIASDLEDQIKQLRIPPQPEKPKGLNEK
jgi:hypothetical protein